MFTTTKLKTDGADQSGVNVQMDDTVLKALRAAHRRKWTTIGSVIALIGLGVGITFYSRYAKESENKVTSKFLQADAMYQSEMETFITNMQSQQNLSPLARPEHANSVKQFEQFIKEYPDSPLTLVAGLRAASEYIERAELDPAIKLLESMLPKTQKHLLFQVRVRRVLASLYADKGDYNKALGELEFLIKLPDNPILSETKLFAAKINFLAGNKDKTTLLLKELAANGEFTLAGDRSTVSSEAAMWLSFWDLK